jgi:hypothetical protein
VIILPLTASVLLARESFFVQWRLKERQSERDEQPVFSGFLFWRRGKDARKGLFPAGSPIK